MVEHFRNNLPENTRLTLTFCKIGLMPDTSRSVFNIFRLQMKVDYRKTSPQDRQLSLYMRIEFQNIRHPPPSRTPHPAALLRVTNNDSTPRFSPRSMSGGAVCS